MNELSVKISNLSVSFGNKDLFEIEQKSAYVNDRIAIIGENGSGKSTLLKIIAGEFPEYEGNIQREVEFNYLPQIGALNKRVDATLDFELLSRLNVPDNEDLSGGEETKFRLVKVLSDYKLGLLLDEPTTHLDAKSIELLFKELEYYYGTLIFVSHDRYFINQLATKIWEVSKDGVKEYVGNYDDYEMQKRQENHEHERQYEQYINEKRRLQRVEEKQIQKANKMSHADKSKSKDIKPDRLAGTKQKETVQKKAYQTAKNIEKRISQMEEIKPVEEETKLKFPQSKSVEIHNSFPIMAQSLTVKRGDKLLLDDVSFQFPLGKTIAITGDNGAGKSSLLQEILNGNKHLTLSPKVKMEIFKQKAYHLESEDSIVKYLMKHTDFQESLVRSILVKLGFNNEEVLKSINALSGGEATRVSLALLFVKPSNVIILDEPTNFIDLKTIEALETFINAYQGTIILTSHDQYFVNRTADEIYKIDDKKLIKY